MRVLVILILVVILWLSITAHAGELIVQGPSYHFGKDYNGNTPGLGYVADNNLTAGIYRNSIDRTSVYAGYRIRASERVSIVVGAVTGYHGPFIRPAAVLVLTQPINDRLAIHLNTIPVKGGFVNLSLGYRLQ